MPPRVRLGRTHGRSNTPRHEIQAGADLSPRQPALRRSHKFTALTEFCKRLLSQAKVFGHEAMEASRGNAATSLDPIYLESTARPERRLRRFLHPICCSWFRVEFARLWRSQAVVR